MKKILVTGLVIYLLSGAVPSLGQDKYEAPAWVKGDTWTLETQSGKKKRYEVMDVTEEGFQLKEGSIYDQRTLNLKFIVKDGKKEKPATILRKMLDFPLFMGKKWEDTVQYTGTRAGRSYTANVDYKMEAQEEITTPAGAFKALRIYAKVISITANYRGESWYKLWYSPEVKFWLKVEFGKSDVWWNVENAMLASYKLKER